MNHDERLVWMDLEMTGLDAEKDTILEIATVITDFDLNIVENGPEIVIFQEESILENMNDWCKEHHGNSGLTEKVRQSKTSLRAAEKETLDFIKRHVFVDVRNRIHVPNGGQKNNVQLSTEFGEFNVVVSL